MNSLVQKLQIVQSKLKAPKGQYNNFGKYKYRSLEDIMEAVKPLLAEVGVFLTLSDEIICVSERHYVKATARFSDGEKEITTTAFAREPLDRKGMDESQITGAASSYARKYALNGLLAIDDTKDADATNEHNGNNKLNEPANFDPPKVAEQPKPPKEPIDVTAIVKQVFFDYTTEIADMLPEGFEWDEKKFEEQLRMIFMKLVAVKRKEFVWTKESTAELAKKIKPDTIITESKAK